MKYHRTLIGIADGLDYSSDWYTLLKNVQDVFFPKSELILGDIQKLDGPSKVNFVCNKC